MISRFVLASLGHENRLRIAATAVATSSALVVALGAQPGNAADFTLPASDTSNPFFFNGSSESSSWSLSDNTGGRSSWGDANNCDINLVSCVYSVSATTAIIYSQPETDTITTWQSGPGNRGNPQGYRVTFRADFDTALDATYLYKVGTNGTEINLVDDRTYTVTVTGNDSLYFIVENVSEFGDLTISNFSASQVPAPLPAAGAATAFGYSRRLRRRIKGVRPAGSNKATVPSHPSVYLNLSPCKLPSLPVSFSYGSLPRPQELERHAA